ncbi:NUDIX hydrolase [Actinomadura barringtoniae]|uniref:NUDIX hydrolase n=1 Tax=Actinomadura barringtoniae TaxID=1427535 RepID=A0A939PL08_9ACTN|nr:NUDIX hydrolase [Actinomadura barringtoniae]MBO2450511.1 NUDIX hydrolase [Actinomadura barringtoniae]
MGDGDGWGSCDQGHTHWGRYGASGVLPFHRGEDGVVRVLLQQRAWWGLGGGTWGMFGGARHSHEDKVTAALRETAEESTLDVRKVNVHGMIVEDHGGWDYASVIGSVDPQPVVEPASRETKRAEWVPVDEVTGRKLFAPFAGSWPTLRTALTRQVLVVDAANVVGARADGWWKDRVGANERLRDDLAVLNDGVTGLAPFDRAFPEVVLVVEGQARGVDGIDGVRVVGAPGSGDDQIVDLVSHPEPDTSYSVVTADRELRERIQAAGASYTGPRWLLERLPSRRSKR